MRSSKKLEYWLFSAANGQRGGTKEDSFREQIWLCVIIDSRQSISTRASGTKLGKGSGLPISCRDTADHCADCAELPTT